MEGRIGTRYLTHDSEDSWWIKQGAKPHPLTSKPQKFQHHTYNNVTILDDPRHGAPKIATNAMIANVQEKPTVTNNQSETNGQSSPTPSNTSRKSVIDMEDPEVQKSELHAKKVGYTVSTV